MKKIQQFDVGTTVRLALVDEAGKAADLSTATGLEVWFGPPKGPGRMRAAILSGAATAGKIEYTLEPGDLDQFGRWQVQGKVSFPAGALFSRVVELDVLPNVQGPTLFLRPDPSALETSARIPAGVG